MDDSSRHGDNQRDGTSIGALRRGATVTPAEIRSRTGTNLNMKQAVGKCKENDRHILMSAETFDQHGESIVLVVLDVSVYDPGMSDSLISAGRLMEAEFQNPL